MTSPAVANAVEIRSLRDLEDARGLVELLYETHGLSFHRPWMYQPELILDRVHRGLLHSLLAMERGRVVGHQALLSPDIDEPPGATSPICNPRLREAGLQLFRSGPDRRQLAQHLAAGIHDACESLGVESLLLRIASHRASAIAAARAAGAQPVGLLLGSVPRWTVYAHEPSPAGSSLSTLLLHIPLRKTTTFLRLVEPEGGEGAAENREGNAPEKQSTELHCRWDGGRQTATIQVPLLGGDLCQRLEQTCRWLVGGHIGHITVYLGIDRNDPQSQARISSLQADFARIGLFFAGLIPAWFANGKDAFVLQALAWQDPNPEHLRFADPRCQRVADRVVAAFRGLESSRDPLAQAAPRGVIIRFDDLQRRRGESG